MQETLKYPKYFLTRRPHILRKEKRDTYEILLGTVFTSKPQPVTDRRPQVIMVLLEKARRPIRVAPTSERVVVPPVEMDRGGFGYVGHIGVHRMQNVHQFRLDFAIG